MLVQLDPTNPISFSRDPLVQESLRTHQGYVETYRSSDLTHHQNALIYSYRVCNPLNEEPMGVLCLLGSIWYLSVLCDHFSLHQYRRTVQGISRGQEQEAQPAVLAAAGAERCIDPPEHNRLA